MYINDIADICSTASVRLFADDVLLYGPLLVLSTWMDAFQGELNVLELWAEK